MVKPTVFSNLILFSFLSVFCRNRGFTAMSNSCDHNYYAYRYLIHPIVVTGYLFYWVGRYLIIENLYLKTMNRKEEILRWVPEAGDATPLCFGVILFLFGEDQSIVEFSVLKKVKIYLRFIDLWTWRFLKQSK